MGAKEAQQALLQMQQQMSNPNFGGNFMSQLNNAGLGAQNPWSFFGTSGGQQNLMNSMLEKVMGYYGGPQQQQQGGGHYQGGTGNPNQNINPQTGAMEQQPAWMRQGFQDKFGWKQAGRPDEPIRNAGGQGGGPWMPGQGGMQYAGGQMPQGFNPFDPSGMGYGISQNGMQYGNGQMPGGDVLAGGMNMGQSYLDQFTNPGELDALFNRIQNQSGIGLGGGVTSDGMGGIGADNLQQMLAALGGQTFGGGGVPAGLPPQAEDWINKQTSSQMDAMNLDYGNAKQNLVQQMFGRGMNASSAAGDSAGKLLYGRSAAMNQIQGQGAQQKLDLYKQIMAQNAAKGGGQGGGAGGGIHVLNPNHSMDAAVNNMRSQLEHSGLPISFEQKMQLAQLQLQGMGMNQQGQLGNRGLDIQQLLGLGGQSLQGQGLEQDFLAKMMGFDLSKQQGAAAMNQSDLARMQQYLMGQSSNFMNIGQQSAQIEAQKQSFWKQLLMGAMGGASSLLGGMASGGTGFFK